MANTKFYQITKTINGVEYEAQYNGNSQFYEFQDECKKNIGGVAELNMKQVAKFIFENVIISPKGLTLDDFDSFEDSQDVITFGIDVMRGNFRNKKDKAGAGTKGKE